MINIVKEIRFKTARSGGSGGQNVNRIYNSLTEKKRHGKKSFAVLIDPDKVNDGKVQNLIDLAITAKVDYFLVGGSLVISNYLDECVRS